MKKKATLFALAGLLVVLLTGAFLVILLQVTGEKETTKADAKDLTMFSAYTDIEAFKNVPAMVTEQGKIENAMDYGSEDYLINVVGATTEEYTAYLSTLETAGFTKHSDNSGNDMTENVMTASYTKENVTVTVSHAVKKDHTYIDVSLDLPLSDHLINKAEYTEGISADAKTKIHLVQLNYSGSSFVIQLKNGHFVIEDGGTKIEAPYLLDYLESLTPEGVTPVVEGWFITHAHSDHSGAMGEIAMNSKYNKRVFVEGVYFVEPSAQHLAYLTLQPGTQENYNITRAYQLFKTEAGEMPKLYRPQIGQVYYFCDITIDVTLTMEQIEMSSYENKDFNDTSTWLMHHIEGQKFLCGGDSRYAGQSIVMSLYDQEYFDVDIFASLHHGINTYNYFVDYCNVDTLLYTSFRAGSIYNDGTWRAALAANEHMRESVKEYYHYGDGTVVLTFPYKLGTAEILESFDWRYNGGTVTKDKEFHYGE